MTDMKLPQTACWPRRNFAESGRPGLRILVCAFAVAASSLLAGCAALTNPVANGIPVRRLPPELLGEAREDQVMLPLNLLRRKPPDTYLLEPGDVLGVYVQDFLGETGGAPPVNFPESADLPPAIGFPIPIRDDGTISLPEVREVRVEGLTIEQAEAAIIKAYTDGELLAPGRERIIVTLIRRRQVRVLVFRQDNPEASNIQIQTGGFLAGSRGTLTGGSTPFGSSGGAGHELELPVGQNDLLNALARTGGLPGNDAANEVIILRGYFDSDQEAIEFFHEFPWMCDPELALAAVAEDERPGRVVRIPLRLSPGQPLPFSPEDVILHSGDILFIQSRDAELFYTGGLLPPGQFPLPRDYDLDVIEAVVSVGGPLVSGGFGINLLSGAIINQGIGNPSPSNLTVLRKTPDGGQVPIQVDLNMALRDPRERILVQPGDVLILQETPGEAFARYFTQTFSFSLFSDVIRTSRTTGTAGVIVP